MVKSVFVPTAPAPASAPIAAAPVKVKTETKEEECAHDDDVVVSNSNSNKEPTIDFSSVFHELQTFQQDHNGSLAIPESHPALSRIIDSLSDLSSVGIIGLSRKRWEKQMKALQSYHEKYGHVNVPPTNHHPLGNWARIQREQYRLYEEGEPNELTKKRYGKLKAIGFDDQVGVRGGTSRSTTANAKSSSRDHSDKDDNDDAKPNKKSSGEQKRKAVDEGMSAGYYDVTRTYTYLSEDRSIKICGCLRCGQTFKGEYKGKIKGRTALKPVTAHMDICCPDLLAVNKRNLFQKCWIRCSNCIVPGFEGGDGLAEDNILAKHKQDKLAREAEAKYKEAEVKYKDRSSMWLTKYDYKLRENVKSDGVDMPAPEDGSLGRLYHILHNKLLHDKFLNAYGVSRAFAHSSTWVTWAVDIAISYPERVKKVWEEHQSQVHENIKLLDKLGKETREGYSGSKSYITVLNFVMHDAFTRCSIPLPPGMNLDQAVGLRNHDPHYKAQMRAFRGYRHRVFGVIKLIEENPINLSRMSLLPEIIPAMDVSR